MFAALTSLVERNVLPAWDCARAVIDDFDCMESRLSQSVRKAGPVVHPAVCLAPLASVAEEDVLYQPPRPRLLAGSVRFPSHDLFDHRGDGLVVVVGDGGAHVNEIEVFDVSTGQRLKIWYHDPMHAAWGEDSQGLGQEGGYRVPFDVLKEMRMVDSNRACIRRRDTSCEVVYDDAVTE